MVGPRAAAGLEVPSDLLGEIVSGQHCGTWFGQDQTHRDNYLCSALASGSIAAFESVDLVEYLRAEFVDFALASAVRDPCDAVLSSCAAATCLAAEVVAAS